MQIDSADVSVGTSHHHSRHGGRDELVIRDHSDLRCLAYDLDELALFSNAVHDATMNAATPEETESALLFLAMLAIKSIGIRDKYGLRTCAILICTHY